MDFRGLGGPNAPQSQLAANNLEALIMSSERIFDVIWQIHPPPAEHIPRRRDSAASSARCRRAELGGGAGKGILM